MPSYTISAHLKNGSPESPIEPTTIIPPKLIHCRELWERRGKRRSWPKNQWTLVRETIEPLLYATIDPEQEHYDNGLLNPKGTIHSQAIELLSCSFEDGLLPIISAYARFDMTFDRSFEDNAAFYGWMASTDWLEWGTNFGWKLSEVDYYNAADDHDGIELELISP